MQRMSAEPTPLSLNANAFAIRRIERGDRHFRSALHLALETYAPSHETPALLVADLLNETEPHRPSAGPVFAIESSSTLVGAMAALESPGRSALVALGAPRPKLVPHGMYVSCLQALQVAAWQRGTKMLEALVDENDTRSAQRGAILADAGFSRLTQLIYLSRVVPRQVTGDCPSDRGQWLNYADDRADLFYAALEASYAQSLDCPELTGLRTPPEVLQTHRAAGAFDPACWWVVLDAGMPVGVALVNLLPDLATAELVYLGVAQRSRGTGLADALMVRALASARHVRAKYLTLAVDARNTPARRFYARWMFAESARRTAWIASPAFTRC